MLSNLSDATAALRLEHGYARLPETFYARVAPTPVAAPRLVRVNRRLAIRLGFDPEFLTSTRGVEILAGNRLPPNAEPVAMAYAGHQFGHFVPSLGDGRAVLLGEVVDRDGVCRDIHLKGAGPTPFSRMGDGRAGLGPVLREYVISEAMAGLGIPTTRALAMLTTGEPIYREQGAEPGAILVRVAASHVRVGTFQYFACRGDRDALRTLADYVIERLAPHAADASEPYRALLDHVIRCQAELIALWMGVGFIHGVMNTDNVSIAAETIDYGPCAFLDTYRPAAVFSSIDHAGRYAYDQQPGIAYWNLTRFAECLLPLLCNDEERAVASAREALDAYPRLYQRSYAAMLGRKLGLAGEREGDARLADDLLDRMAEHGADFTLAFRRLSDVVAKKPETLVPVRALFADPTAFDDWAERWLARLAAEGSDDLRRQQSMRAANPAFIPRNHRVQQAIEAATREQDLQPLAQLLEVVTHPYEDHPHLADFMRPPEPHQVVHRTFCGT